MIRMLQLLVLALLACIAFASVVNVDPNGLHGKKWLLARKQRTWDDIASLEAVIRPDESVMAAHYLPERERKGDSRYLALALQGGSVEFYNTKGDIVGQYVSSSASGHVTSMSSYRRYKNDTFLALGRASGEVEVIWLTEDLGVDPTLRELEISPSVLLRLPEGGAAPGPVLLVRTLRRGGERSSQIVALFGSGLLASWTHRGSLEGMRRVSHTLKSSGGNTHVLDMALGDRYAALVAPHGVAVFEYPQLTPMPEFVPCVASAAAAPEPPQPPPGTEGPPPSSTPRGRRGGSASREAFQNLTLVAAKFDTVSGGERRIIGVDTDGAVHYLLIGGPRQAKTCRSSSLLPLYWPSPSTPAPHLLPATSAALSEKGLSDAARRLEEDEAWREEVAKEVRRRWGPDSAAAAALEGLGAAGGPGGTTRKGPFCTGIRCSALASPHPHPSCRGPATVHVSRDVAVLSVGPDLVVVNTSALRPAATQQAWSGRRGEGLRHVLSHGLEEVAEEVRKALGLSSDAPSDKAFPAPAPPSSSTEDSASETDPDDDILFSVQDPSPIQNPFNVHLMEARQAMQKGGGGAARGEAGGAGGALSGISPLAMSHFLALNRAHTAPKRHLKVPLPEGLKLPLDLDKAVAAALDRAPPASWQWPPGAPVAAHVDGLTCVALENNTFALYDNSISHPAPADLLLAVAGPAPGGASSLLGSVPVLAIVGMIFYRMYGVKKDDPMDKGREALDMFMNPPAIHQEGGFRGGPRGGAGSVAKAEWDAYMDAELGGASPPPELDDLDLLELDQRPDQYYSNPEYDVYRDPVDTREGAGFRGSGGSGGAPEGMAAAAMGGGVGHGDAGGTGGAARDSMRVGEFPQYGGDMMDFVELGDGALDGRGSGREGMEGEGGEEEDYEDEYQGEGYEEEEEEGLVEETDFDAPRGRGFISRDNPRLATAQPQPQRAQPAGAYVDVDMGADVMRDPVLGVAPRTKYDAMPARFAAPQGGGRGGGGRGLSQPGASRIGPPGSAHVPRDISGLLRNAGASAVHLKEPLTSTEDLEEVLYQLQRQMDDAAETRGPLRQSMEGEGALREAFGHQAVDRAVAQGRLHRPPPSQGQSRGHNSGSAPTPGPSMMDRAAEKLSDIASEAVNRVEEAILEDEGEYIRAAARGAGGAGQGIRGGTDPLLVPRGPGGRALGVRGGGGEGEGLESPGESSGDSGEEGEGPGEVKKDK